MVALPDYADELAAFHRAFATELEGVIERLPLAPGMRVLDAACGDGFYTRLLARRLGRRGMVIGLDNNRAALQIAQERVARENPSCPVEFVETDIAALDRARGRFDFVWCAQSLFTLPEPYPAVRHMAAALRRGGHLAVLENDTMHQLLLPWPSHLEVTLKTAEHEALKRGRNGAARFYVGRRLPALLAAAGFERVKFRTQSIDRQAPLAREAEIFLEHYLATLSDRVMPYLEAEAAREFTEFVDPRSPHYLLRNPVLTMSWINAIAWGRKKDRFARRSVREARVRGGRQSFAHQFSSGGPS